MRVSIAIVVQLGPSDEIFEDERVRLSTHCVEELDPGVVPLCTTDRLRLSIELSWTEKSRFQSIQDYAKEDARCCQPRAVGIREMAV